MELRLWRRITEIYHAAVTCRGEDRVAFLDEACGDDYELRGQVGAMVKSHEATPEFMETPAFALAPELLSNESAGALANQQVGRYRIQSLIGVGGMGEVYLARDERLGRKIALKILPVHLTTDEAQLSRFDHEARAASALNHPNILTVHEIGGDGMRHFIATEFIEGMTLRATIARGSLSLHEVLDVAVQVGSALAAAHESGIVHRDIKPENIMLRPDGYVKVLDFGIAKLTEKSEASGLREAGGEKRFQTQSGLVSGTAQYMSPEQARGLAVDARTDIWSFGVVLYEMLAGRPPFDGETSAHCIASILKKEPQPLPSLSLPAAGTLQSIVHKALRKDPDERYQSIGEMRAELRKLKSAVDAEGSSSQISRKRSAILLLGIGVLAASAAFYFSHSTTALQPAVQKSIAILPFADLSPTHDQQYFCDGLQEEIVTRLSRIADLKVISRTSTLRYNSAPKNLPEIARQLGVAHLLEGSVQKSNERMRVNVQLIKGATDTHLWAATFDRKLTDIFAVESEIAKTIASALQAKINGQEIQAVITEPTQNIEAHQLYLKGRYFWNKRTAKDLKKSLDYFNRAIAADPHYTLPYAGIADAYILLPTFQGGTPEECYPLAKAAARKAVELDETSAEAHTSLANALWLADVDSAQASKEFQRAIALNPKYATAHHWYGNNLLVSLGRFDEAVDELKRALELDPLSIIINTDLGRTYYFARRYDEAIDQFRKALEMDSGFYFVHRNLGCALEMKGAFAEAIELYHKARTLSDDSQILALLAHAYAFSGDRTAAMKMMEQLKELSKQQYVSAYSFATVFIGLGDKEEALRWLEKSYHERAGGQLARIKVDPFLDPLRGDPRFEALANKVVP